MADPVTKLILELSKLPSIGEKTAMRLAYHVLRTEEADVRVLAETLLDAKRKIRLCEECFTFTEVSPCLTCSDVRRKQELICVVEKPADVLAIENSQRFHGTYHVLHGVLSPLDGVGPEQLRIKELVMRLGLKQAKEVILALNPTVEGEATGVYLSKLLKPLGVAVSKIAHGIPVGGVLEYIDRQTIGRAIENRVATL
jgi:recombination protein RecR